MYRIERYPAPAGALQPAGELLEPPPKILRTRLSLLTLALALAGCAAVPETDYKPVAERLNARLPQTAAIALAGDETAEQRANELLAQPLTPTAAVQLTLLQSPRLRAELAELGVVQADLTQAGLISNPRFAVGALRPEGGGRWQLDFGLSASLLDVLTRPLRRSLAENELQRVQLAVTDTLQRELNAVQRDYYAALTAGHRAELLKAIEAGAEASRDLAQRLLDAGNTPELDFLREQAEFEQRRLATLQGRAEAERARLQLAQRIGIDDAAALQLPEALPDLPAERFDATALQAQATRDRLDLQLARQAQSSRQRELALFRKTRGVTELEVGVQAEREFDGAENYGPELAVGLPLFDQNQARIAAAESRLAQSDARIRAAELAARNDIARSLLALDIARERAERLRKLIPQRERIVELSLRNYNFMIDGISTTLLAKREEYATYLDYVDAVGDYWLARSQLALAVGGALPEPKTAPAPLPKPATGSQTESGHGGMDHSGHGASQPKAPAHNGMNHDAHRPAPAAPQAPAGHSHSHGDHP